MDFLPVARGVLGGGGGVVSRTAALLPPWSYQAGDRCVIGTQDILGPWNGHAEPCLGGQQRCPWGVPLALQSKTE